MTELTEQTIRVHDRTFRPYIHRHEIDELVGAIAARINSAYAGKELTVLVILKGAMIFASDLVRRLRVPCVIEVLRASSYGPAMRSSGTLNVESVLPEIENRHVLIVEDIIDSGTTIVELIKHISGLNPASVTIAALLSKPDSHKEKLVIDYVGREIAPDFVVGYGMDYAGYGRELDAIWVVSEDYSSDDPRT